MKQRRIPAVFMRGGTSKAVMFHARDLPTERDAWAPIFRSAIGANDPSGRQLDGMGGGVSSLSKVCVIGPPSRTDADVDFTFAQIGVTDDTVDYAGNCGNMSSAIGPFAIDEGLVARAGRRPRRRAHPQYQYLEDHRRPLRSEPGRSRRRRRDGARRRRRHRFTDPARVHGTRRRPHRQAAADRPCRRHARHSGPRPHRGEPRRRRQSLRVRRRPRTRLHRHRDARHDRAQHRPASAPRSHPARRLRRHGHRARPRGRRPHQERAQGRDGHRAARHADAGRQSRSAPPTWTSQSA